LEINFNFLHRTVANLTPCADFRIKCLQRIDRRTYVFRLGEQFANTVFDNRGFAHMAALTIRFDVFLIEGSITAPTTIYPVSAPDTKHPCTGRPADF
jgi:hypothetical protein